MGRLSKNDSELKELVNQTIMWRRFGTGLPDGFWRLPQYKWKASNEFKAINKFIKKYGLNVVARAVMQNRDLVTFTDYAKAEVYLQQEAEIQRLRDLPKDTSPVAVKKQSKVEDLRENRNPPKKKGLFERLSEVTSG